MFSFRAARSSMSRFGVRHMAEFSGRARALGLQTIAEATVCGLVFAVWWRMSHIAEKSKYDKYYAQLRAEQAALADE